MRKIVLLVMLFCQAASVPAQTTAGAPLQPQAKNVEKLLKILKDHSSSYVMVGAHRGDWRNEPENSLAAIGNCIDMGVDMVEIDVRRTKDGQFILMHDETLDRTTTGQGKVADWTLDDIKKLFLKNPYGKPSPRRVPTLEEALLFAKDKILVYLDKSPDHIREIYPLLQNTGTNKQAFFYGYATAQELQRLYGSLLDSINYLPKVTDKTKDIAGYVEGLNKRLHPPVYMPEFASEESPAFRAMASLKVMRSRILVAPLYPNLCAGRLDDLAVDDPGAHWGWAIDQGADMFFTDRPALLLQYLRTRGLHD